MNSVMPRVFPDAENQFSPGAENGGNCANNDSAQFTRFLRRIVLEYGAVLRIGHFDALLVRFVH